MPSPDIQALSLFKKKVWSYYREYKRPMAWRENITPYKVVVSEIMLQQTQVDRVAKKFDVFVKKFPDWRALAEASRKDVLQEWSGLGYNRRALYLKEIAETITKNGKMAGTLPRTLEELRELPGIGPNTAGSILAFAFNIPHPFIETNIRSVFIHEFFRGSKNKVPDTKIMPLIEKTLDKKNPREWYYALMDYGSHLKKSSPNPSRKSAHHIKQKPFKGSNRELRSAILKIVMKQSSRRETIEKQLEKYAGMDIKRNLNDLVREGFFEVKGGKYKVA